MARLNAQQASTFPTNTGSTSFLSLANDGDTAIIRFAYNTINDIPIHLVHDVDGEDGISKHVGCLRTSYDQPASVCPLCLEGYQTKKVIYFNVRNEETGDMQLWQRTESFFRRNILPIFEELENEGIPICSVPFKIKRSGAKGDMKTTYSLIQKPADGMTLQDFPEDIIVEEIGIVKDFDYNTLQTIAETGVIPNSKNNNKPEEITRRGNNQNFGQPAKVENHNESLQQTPINRSRRTIMNNDNNGGY